MSSDPRRADAGSSADLPGDLFVLSAPSGAGKTSLVRRLFEHYPRVARGLTFSVSHASREPRPGEEHGKDYYFVDEAEFRRLVDQNAFLEWAVVHGQLKGTSLAEVERQRATGLDVLLELDVQGAAQVRRRLPSAISIFVLPPSFDELQRRLRARGSEDEAQLRRRRADAVGEIREAMAFDYAIVNHDLASAAEALAAIFLARRCHRDRMRSSISRVLQTLPPVTDAPGPG